MVACSDGAPVHAENEVGLKACRPSEATMRGVERTVAVLRALNERNGSRISDLSKATAIPRPSLYRILEALLNMGYVRRRQDSERYELTLMVRTLSDGFRDEDWVRCIALPVVEALQREIVWPAEISTFFRNAMCLRETTRNWSPLTVDHQTAGLRVPLMLSAAGRAYIAFSPDSVRETVLGNLRQSNDLHDLCSRDLSYVRNVLAMTRRNGYGERHGEVFKKTGAIALPIFLGSSVICCLGITFIASALTTSEAAARYLEPMREAARAIQEGLAKHKQGATLE